MLAAIRRRLRATVRVWKPGGAHLRLISAPEPVPAAVVDAPAPDAAPRAPAAGSVDQPLWHAQLERGVAAFGGWAVFDDGPAVRVELWLGDYPLGPARLGVTRPHAREQTDLRGAEVSGWEHVVNLNDIDVTSGPVALRVRATGPSGQTLELPRVDYVVVDETVGPRLPVNEFPAAARVALQVPEAGEEFAARLPRLLVFTHRLDVGGAQLYLAETLESLKALGEFECAVVSFGDGPLRYRLTDAGFHVHVTSPLPVDNHVEYQARIDELAAWAGGRYELAFLNTALAYPGADVAAQLGIRAVWAIHESYTPEELWFRIPGLSPEVRRRAESGLARAGAAVFEAEATRRLYAPTIGEERCLTIPYGVRLPSPRDWPDRQAARAERGFGDDSLVVLCVGTVEPRKGQVPLVDAFSAVAEQFPSAQLVLVGAGEDRDSLAFARYVESSPLAARVRIEPLARDVWPWFVAGDVVACASDVESLPRVIIEAMACGVPVLATDVFGAPELIEDGVTGWLVEPRDTRVLAEALKRALAAPPEERRRLGAAAREFVVERHALDPYARRLAALMRQVAESDQPAAAVIG